MAITAPATRTSAALASTTTTVFSYTSGADGDLLVLVSEVPSTSVHATAVSGGTVANWLNCATSTGTGLNYLTMWWGKVGTAGTANITITYSATATGLFPLYALLPFRAGTGASTPWAVVDSAGKQNAASASLVYPSLGASAAGQLYVGLGATATAGTSTTTGSTTGGWVWQTDSYADSIPYNLSIGPGTITPPNATNSPSSVGSNSVGAIFTSVAAGGVTPRGGFFPFMGHHDDESTYRRRPNGLYVPDSRRLALRAA